MLIFLDGETTGLDKEDKICSLGLVSVDDEENIKTKYELVNEGKKISAEASSVNHLTNEMLKDKITLNESNIYKYLILYNTQETTIVGHNITFIMQKLHEVGFKYKGLLIDTLRVSKHLIQECESYSLQFLRYELKLYKMEIANIQAHHALGDAEVIKNLYTYFLEMVSQEEMHELSFKNVLLEKFTFGKYKGKYIEEIVMNDRKYIDWMITSLDLDDDLRYSIGHYLEGS